MPSTSATLPHACLRRARAAPSPAASVPDLPGRAQRPYSSRSTLRRSGKIRIHRSATAIGPDTADHRRRHRPDQRRHHPALELAELVRGVDEEEVHRPHPPAHRRRACEAGPARCGSPRSPCRPRPSPPAPPATAPSSATARRPRSPSPKTITAWNIRMPTRRVIEVPRQQHGHRQRADRRRPAQRPEPPGAGVQDVAGEDRHQRRRPAEQHREEVERDRPEDRPCSRARSATPAKSSRQPRPGPSARRRGRRRISALRQLADDPEARHQHVGQPRRRRDRRSRRSPARRSPRAGSRPWSSPSPAAPARAAPPPAGAPRSPAPRRRWRCRRPSPRRRAVHGQPAPEAPQARKAATQPWTIWQICSSRRRS